jgi:hypothetical protein
MRTKISKVKATFQQNPAKPAGHPEDTKLKQGENTRAEEGGDSQNMFMTDATLIMQHT